MLQFIALGVVAGLAIRKFVGRNGANDSEHENDSAKQHRDSASDDAGKSRGSNRKAGRGVENAKHKSDSTDGGNRSRDGGARKHDTAPRNRETGPVNEADSEPDSEPEIHRPDGDGLHRDDLDGASGGGIVATGEDDSGDASGDEEDEEADDG